MAVYVHGDGTGPFAEGPIASGLEMIFKADTTEAGLVRPVNPFRCRNIRRFAGHAAELGDR